MPLLSHKMGHSNTISSFTLSKEEATAPITYHRNQLLSLSQEQAILWTVISSSKTPPHHRFKYLRFTGKITRATTTNTSKWAKCIQIIKEEHLEQPSKATVFSMGSLASPTRRSKVGQLSQRCLQLTKISRNNSNSIKIWIRCQRPICIKMLLMEAIELKGVILKMRINYLYGKILRISR